MPASIGFSRACQARPRLATRRSPSGAEIDAGAGQIDLEGRLAGEYLGVESGLARAFDIGGDVVDEQGPLGGDARLGGDGVEGPHRGLQLADLMAEIGL